MQSLTIQGQPVPTLGFGTWPLKGEECRLGVEDALALGYRHIDTAQGYENEAEVGQAMKRAGIPREEVFLVTKVRPGNFTYDKTLSSSYASLKKLDAGYIDLLLLHWPNPDVPLAETLRAMRKLQDEGIMRHIGVSNFSTALVEESAQHATIFCNQVEFHPYHPQRELLAQAKQMDYLLTAYSPVARGKVMTDPVLQQIGAAHGKTPAQVALRWLVQQGASVIPKAASNEHRRANLAIFDFALSTEEMAAIDALGGAKTSVL